jgi:regulator of protease activity HflC (stomatin/prohibitin superfamily)
MFERYRIQIDVFENDREQAEVYADKVEQAIIAGLNSPFRSVYGLMDIRKLVDTDQGPTEQLQREAHSILDYEGWIITDKTD